MIRKLLANLLMAFVLFPVFISVRHWGNIINGIYKVEDMYFDSFWEYILYITTFPLLPALFFLLILCPFQLLKDYFNRKGRPLYLVVKCVIFSLFVTVCYALLSRGYLANIMRYSPMSFWGPIILAGIIFPVSLYFLVDRYVERQPDHGKKNTADK